MLKIAKGIWPTMVTPFTETNKIDDHALALQIEWYISHGCDGLFAVCQSSEMFYLSQAERTYLAQRCVELAAGRIPVIASGHVSDSRNEQISEIRAIWATGVSAVVLVSNRLAEEHENDDVWIENAEAILDALPQATFGMYECPYPYKRLISEKTLKWMTKTGRFSFIKDTCCNTPLIKQRLKIIKACTPQGEEPMGLYNANTMTLLESLQAGADGFCGVMGNLHPELYQWLFQHYQTEPVKARELQAALTLLSSLEGQAYPICAKKHLQLAGIPMTLETRAISADTFAYAQAETLRQAQQLEGLLKRLYINGKAYAPRWHSQVPSTLTWRKDAVYPPVHNKIVGIRKSIIHYADETYQFLHDTMIVCFKNRLLCAWYNCTENEIVGDTVIRGRWSADNGVTWGEPEIIAQAKKQSGFHMVPAAFAQVDDELYAFITEMSSHDRPVGFYTYRYEGEKWVQIARSPQPVLFNTQPLQLATGLLISAGRMSDKPGKPPYIPCVMFSSAQAPNQWKVRPLPGPWQYCCYPLLFPETTLMTAGDHLTAITRNDGGCAQVFESFDGGTNWSDPHDAELPIAASKMCGGMLHNGHQYLIYNEQTTPPGRERLVIALRKDSTSAFDRVFTIFDGMDRELEAGPMWHYPCAVEYKEALYITCTASRANDIRRHAALAVIPVCSLM